LLVALRNNCYEYLKEKVLIFLFLVRIERVLRICECNFAVRTGNNTKMYPVRAKGNDG